MLIRVAYKQIWLSFGHFLKNSFFLLKSHNWGMQPISFFPCMTLWYSCSPPELPTPSSKEHKLSFLPPASSQSSLFFQTDLPDWLVFLHVGKAWSCAYKISLLKGVLPQPLCPSGVPPKGFCQPVSWMDQSLSPGSPRLLSPFSKDQKLCHSMPNMPLKHHISLQTFSVDQQQVQWAPCLLGSLSSCVRQVSSTCSRNLLDSFLSAGENTLCFQQTPGKLKSPMRTKPRGSSSLKEISSSSLSCLGGL